MSNKKSGKRGKNKKVFLIVIGIAVIVVIAVAALWIRRGDMAVSPGNSENISAEQEETADNGGEAESAETDNNSEETAEDATPEDISAGEENTGSTNQELEDRATAPYEYWLSAAILTGISIEYPTFEPGEFYVSGETELSDSTSSSGIYVTFYVDGQEKCIYGAPLEAERSDVGTKDIYSDVIGFARFDEVSTSEIPGNFSPVDIANINELIEQSVTVALYEH